MPVSPYDYIHDLSIEDLSPASIVMAKRLLLDITGVALAGARTDLSRIIRDHAARHFGAGTAGGAQMLRDGRVVSPLGAAMAGGMTIDALDAHDGQKLTKGHIACAAFPATLAMMEAEGRHDPRELLVSLALGYEIGTRAGIALHRTVSDYHTSGAWMAVGCAALGARALGLDRAKTREAMGIAEYHGPRSQMMRCIDHPTMVKDGSGWGAMAGLSAAYLAQDGFSGAPALTVDGDDVADVWADLGQHDYLHAQYIKLYPVCRWAQPPLQAVLGLRDAHKLSSGDVECIEVTTFHEAVRLAVRHPDNTEQAQYSTAYPTAVAMVRGTVGADEVTEAAFNDPEVRRLAGSMVFSESDAYNAAFPANRIAHVQLVLRDGRVLKSDSTEALGDPEHPLTDAQVLAKFLGLVDPVMGSTKASELAAIIGGLETHENMAALNAYLYAPHH